jgi:hypothetical protein
MSMVHEFRSRFMRERALVALAASLLALLPAAGCADGSGEVLDPGGGEVAWAGTYVGEGDILSVVNATTCSGAIVGLTLLPDGEGGLSTEIWWEQAKQNGLDCPYETQCAPASDFNVNNGGSCSIFNLRGTASSDRFVGEDGNGLLRLVLSLDRAGGHLSGRLVTQPLTHVVVPHGEITFQANRCGSLPCP